MPNFFTGLWGRLKNFIVPQAAVQRAFDVSPAVSQTMEQNINLWYAMYINQPPWKTKDVLPLGLPSAICRELARPVLVEFAATITGSARAEFLHGCFQKAQEGFLRQLELGLAMGGVAFRPYLYGGRLLVDATSAAAFQPTKFDAADVCTGGVFRDRARVEGRYYVRLEYHDLEGGRYTVRNRAFRSDENGLTGEEVQLAAVPAWAELQPEAVIEGVSGPLFAYFKTPIANTVDPESPVGVSIYSGAAVHLIQQADEQMEQLRWEYRSGERKIFADGTASSAAQFQNRLFEYGPFTSDSNFFQPFAPEFRDEPLYRGFQNILKQLEFQIGLSYGTVSDPQSVEKTATEIRSGKQRMYVTVDSIQKALQHTFDALLYAMDVYASLYHLAPEGSYVASYDWGDSVLNDEDTKNAAFNRDLQMVGSGILNAWEFRAKWLQEDEETAKAMLPELNALV